MCLKRICAYEQREKETDFLNGTNINCNAQHNLTLCQDNPDVSDPSARYVLHVLTSAIYVFSTQSLPAVDSNWSVFFFFFILGLVRTFIRTLRIVLFSSVPSRFRWIDHRPDRCWMADTPYVFFQTLARLGRRNWRRKFAERTVLSPSSGRQISRNNRFLTAGQTRELARAVPSRENVKSP